MTNISITGAGLVTFASKIRVIQAHHTVPMSRYFLEVMYDGTLFHGSQLQRATPTVQLYINQALSTLLRTPIESFGASRTDEGVHALTNFYHFDTATPLHPDFLYKMNALLPAGIAAKEIYTSQKPEANARFDALSRTYRYRIYFDKNPFLFKRALYYPYKLDRKLLQQTADMIREYENFESFSKRNTQTHTFLCRIHESKWEIHSGEIHYIVRANRFLRGMVRGLVSTQLQVARGRFSLDHFREILDARDCTKADFSVAGHGLYLEKINYPEGFLEEVKNIR